MKILVTGFEPFAEYTENSSWAVAELLAAAHDLPVDLITERLPVSFTITPIAFRDAVRKHNPDFVVMLGQAAKSEVIRLERVALNLMDATKPDNDGYWANEEVIDTNSPTAYISSLVNKKLLIFLKEQGFPVVISNSCGLYVCNRLHYEALKYESENPSIKHIFIHVPLTSTLPVSLMVQVLKQVILHIIKGNCL